MITWPFGKAKDGQPAGPNYGKPITEVSDKALQWASENVKVEGQYAAQNKTLLDAVNQEILRRAQSKVSAPTKAFTAGEVYRGEVQTAEKTQTGALILQEIRETKAMLSKVLGIVRATLGTTSLEKELEGAPKNGEEEPF